MFIPFLLGASAIGLALMLAEGHVALVYAANLAGSGAGALVAMALIANQPPQWLAPTTAAITFLAVAAIALRPASFTHGQCVVAVIAAAAIAIWLCLDTPTIRVDPFKYGAYVQRLEKQGSATCLAARSSRRGLVEAYAGGQFHEMPFLSVGQTPPPLCALLVDKHWAGSLLEVGKPEEARAVEQSMMAIPYALGSKNPRVLLLGERGGSNIWLAAGQGAARIDVVQPHAALFEMLRGPLRSRGGHVLDLDPVRTYTSEPRHYVEQVRQQYDLIQLVTLEGSAAGSGGVAGIGQDYLVTVEGLRSCLNRLAPAGVLSVCRGIQSPPRDNIKLLALFATALEELDIMEPGAHIVVLRDYLAVCTLVRRTPWTDADSARIRQLCRDRQLTPVWFRGIRNEELNQPDALDSPPEVTGDWYHHAAKQIFSPAREHFVASWHFDIRPPTDNRPFFRDYFKLSSIAAMRQAFGESWLSRAEIAFLFVLVTVVVTSAFAALLTLVPIAVIGRSLGSQWPATAVYFGAIGLGYLVLEITLLSRLVHLIGDPVEAAAIAIATFLLGSGLGSAVSHRWQVPSRIIFVLVIAFAIALQAVFGPLANWTGGWPVIARTTMAVAVMAPLAFVLGFPMPMGLSRLATEADALVPWAWGVNGFASVIAAPVATAIAMAWGYWQAAALALGCYAIAAVVYSRLSGVPR